MHIMKPLLTITFTVRSKACVSLNCSRNVIVDSNPTQSMDVNPPFFYVVLSCVGSGLATGPTNIYNPNNQH
jgi:hypothetical protein